MDLALESTNSDDKVMGFRLAVSRRWLAEETIVVLLLMAVTLLVIVSALLQSVIYHSDQFVHLEFAKVLHDSGVLPTAHFLYQASVSLAHTLTGEANWSFSALMVNLLSNMLVAALLYLALRDVFSGFDRPSQRIGFVRALCAVLALGLTLATPIVSVADTIGGIAFENASTGFNPLLLGFVTPMVYHNPTMLILRPFALALYLLIARYVIQTEKGRPSALTGPQIAALVVVTAITTILCGLSKPNYILPLLPALGLWLVWNEGIRKRLWRKRLLNWASPGVLIAVGGVLIPATLSLLWQFFFTYVTPTEQLSAASIAFSPFDVVLSISGGSRAMMILRFAVSIAFPLLVYAVYGRGAWRDGMLNFAWVTFGFGALLMYFFAETGDRRYHGNFLWSGYITFFVLNFASARFALMRWLENRTMATFDWRTLAIGLVFAGTVISGIQFMTYFTTWVGEFFSVYWSQYWADTAPPT